VQRGKQRCSAWRHNNHQRAEWVNGCEAGKSLDGLAGKEGVAVRASVPSVSSRVCDKFASA
jgi:hypothetical protein